MLTSPQKILIVDDEPDLRRSLAMVLQSEGYHLTEAGTVQAGIECVSREEFDLIFLDMKLPDGSGTNVFPTIQSKYPGLPVIILTGHATLETAIEAVHQGAREYLLKPADPEIILARTKALLEEKNLPHKRQEITTQIQSLLQELKQYNADKQAPAQEVAAPPSTNPERYIKYGTLVVDLYTRHAMVVNKTVPFSSSTFEYLVTLMRHAPNVVSHQTLVREAQGYTVTRAEALDICRWQIHELRKGIEEHPDKPVHIITVRGMGYRMAG
jgi:DNA-binding response OmpR family regulator